MRNKTPYQWILALLLCGLLVMMPVAVLATDDDPGDEVPAAEVTAEVADGEIAPVAETNDADEGPQGVGTLMMLLGMGGVIAVGATMIARDNYKDTNDDE